MDPSMHEHANGSPHYSPTVQMFNPHNLMSAHGHGLESAMHHHHHHSPTGGHGSPTAQDHSSQMYGIVSHDYTGAHGQMSPYATSPVAEHFTPHHALSSPVIHAPRPMSMNDNVVHRPLTRSQRKDAAQDDVHATPSSSQHRDHADFYATPITRPHTPSSSTQNPPMFSLERPPLNLNVLQTPQRHQPQYPATPHSLSPAYPTSAFMLRGTSSRTPSYPASVASNPRSTSPAMSSISALTSISSSASAMSHGSATANAEASSAKNTVFKHKKTRLTNKDRKDICLYAAENPLKRQEDIAAMFHVERSTISKILKKKNVWLELTTPQAKEAPSNRVARFPAIESGLIKWLEHWRDSGCTPNLTDQMLRKEAKRLASEQGIEESEFKASGGWLENFKQRNGVRRGQWHGGGRVLSIDSPRSGSSPGSPRPLTSSHRTSNASSGALSPLNPAFDTQLGSIDSQVSSSIDQAEDHNNNVMVQDEGGWSQETRMDVVSSTVDSTQGSLQYPSQMQPETPATTSSDMNDPSCTYMSTQQSMQELHTAMQFQPTPSLDQVKNSMDMVIKFINDQSNPVISSEERSALENVKNAIGKIRSGNVDMSVSFDVQHNHQHHQSQ